MGKYNFDAIIDRRGTNSYKWDSAAPGVLPLWVADMDFATAPAVSEALRRRMEHPIFGYTRVPAQYYDAVVSWFERRHQFAINSNWIIYTSGVVPAISAVIKALTSPGDNVLVTTPVYNCFFSSIRNNGCNILESPLIYNNLTYTIDWDDFEQKASLAATKVFLLCNPHNPAGRVWTRDELARIATICHRHGVMVIADEIHCELTMPGYKYTPYATVSEVALHESVTCISPSKAFNIAGLQIANIVAADEGVRSRIDRAININEVCDVNPFGVIATIAAYNDGEEWLNELCQYIYGNYQHLQQSVSKLFPKHPINTLEGTYLAWQDVRSLGIESTTLEERLVAEAQLWLNSGTMYGIDGFMRWNLACPRATLQEAVDRFHQWLGCCK